MCSACVGRRVFTAILPGVSLPRVCLQLAAFVFEFFSHFSHFIAYVEVLTFSLFFYIVMCFSKFPTFPVLS